MGIINTKYVKSVSGYAHATLDIYFPNGDVTCHNCEMLYVDKAGRPRCGHTNIMLWYPRDGIHESCPLKFDDTPDTQIF